jgi:hypothetical protein
MRLIAEPTLPPIPDRISVPPPLPPNTTLEEILDISAPHPQRGAYLAEWEWRVKYNNDIAALEERLTRTSQDILEFAKEYFPEMFRAGFGDFHREITDLILNIEENEWYYTAEDGEKREKRGIVIAAPRGHGKSTILTFLFPLYCAVFRIKRFIIIFSNNKAGVTQFCTSLKRELEENEKLRADFGDLVGKSYGRQWGAFEFIACHANQDADGDISPSWETKIMGVSMGTNVRGFRFGPYRPDAVFCHEKGTRICVDGQWMNVEDHPTATFVQKEGLSVSLRGLPLPEVVTRDHLYWVRQYEETTAKRIASGEPFKSEGWVESQLLDKHSYIGTPIKTRVDEVQGIPYYVPGLNIERDEKTGRIVTSRGGYVTRVPKEFSDPEWWWLFGLWWGDGHIPGKQRVGLTIADKDVVTFLRVKSILEQAGIPYITIPKEGCFQLVFCHAALSRWLKSWRIGNSRKQPPTWVEYLDFSLQRQLVQGYIAADGWVDTRKKTAGVRLTSIHLEGLYCVRRILARLGVAATIRMGAGPRTEKFRGGRTSETQQKYDLYFKDGASLLGYPIETSSRYTLKACFIEDGKLWTKVTNVTDAGLRTFVPIQTKTHDYVTHFGLSHNCDDIEKDENVQTLEQRNKLQGLLAQRILPMLDPRTGIFIFCGTMIHFDSLLARLMSHESKDGWVQRLYRCTKDIDGRPVDILDPKAIPLWPEWWSLQKLRGMRLTPPMTLHEWNTEWMNDPHDPENRDFLPEWVRWYHRGSDLRFNSKMGEYEWCKPGDMNSLTGEPRWQRLYVYQAVDPSVGESAHNDYFVMITIGLSAETHDIILLHLVRGHFNFAEQVNTIESQFMQFPMTIGCGLEAQGYQAVLAQTILSRQAKRYKVRKIPVKKLTQTKNRDGKIGRLRRRAWDMQTGTVWFPYVKEGDKGYSDAPYSEDAQAKDRVRVHSTFAPLYTEMMEFPKSRNDDTLDAFDMAMTVLGRRRMFGDYAEAERLAKTNEDNPLFKPARRVPVQPGLNAQGGATVVTMQRMGSKRRTGRT